MTVGELIKRLEKCPANAEVYYRDWERSRGAADNPVERYAYEVEDACVGQDNTVVVLK